MSWRNPFGVWGQALWRVLGLAALLAVGGCSGSDSGTSTAESASGTPTVSATGIVNTSEIGGTGLNVLSFHAEESPIGQDGAFATTVSLGKAQVLFITDGNGAIRGLTLSITTANNSTLQVDATSTALGLLFLTPGILTLDPTEAQARVARLKAFPSFVTLVNFLQAHLKTGSVQTLKAGPDFSNLLLACVEEWQASQPVPQQAASIARLALPTQPPSVVSSAIGSLVIPSASSVEEEAGLVRVVVNVGPPDLLNIPVRIQNKGWRWVRLYRVSRDLNNEVVGVGQVPINEDLDPIKPLSLGSIFTGTASQPTETTDTISFPDNVKKVQYWIVGPGLGLNPLLNSTETDMPAQAGHEPHHPASNKTDLRLGVKTMWDFSIQPVLGILGVEFKSTTAGLEVVDELITLGKCALESEVFFTPDGTRRGKLSAATELAVCIINVISDEDDVSIWARLRNLPSKATAVGVLRAITSGLDLANFSLAVSSFLQVPHLALIEIEKKIGDVQFSHATYSVDKTAGSATISVNRVGAANGILRVNYATSDETAKSGEDYTPATGTLTWQDKDSEPKTFVVPVKDNPANTVSRSLTLTLKNPIGGRLGNPHSATLKIDDGCPDPEPDLTLTHSNSGSPELLETNSVLSFNRTVPGASISATGSKGNVRLSASATEGLEHASTNIIAKYRDYFIVTSPGKSGRGRATAVFTSSSSAAVACNGTDDYFTSANAVAEVGYGVAGYSELPAYDTRSYYQIVTQCPTFWLPDGTPVTSHVIENFSSPRSIDFIYGPTPWSGANQWFDVHLSTLASASAPNHTSGSSTVSIGYSVIPDDKDAKVTWCRATR